MRVARHSKTQTGTAGTIVEPDRNDSVARRVAASSAETADWVFPAGPRGIARVPTHTVGRVRERRAYVRARLALPLHVRRVAGQPNAKPLPLRTKDISSSGVSFLYPGRIEPGTPIVIEVVLVEGRLVRGTVRMCTEAHVVRAQAAEKPGWHGLAAAFDDIRFVREEPFPAR